MDDVVKRAGVGTWKMRVPAGIEFLVKTPMPLPGIRRKHNAEE